MVYNQSVAIQERSLIKLWVIHVRRFVKLCVIMTSGSNSVTSNNRFNTSNLYCLTKQGVQVIYIEAIQGVTRRSIRDSSPVTY